MFYIDSSYGSPKISDLVSQLNIFKIFIKPLVRLIKDNNNINHNSSKYMTYYDVKHKLFFLRKTQKYSFYEIESSEIF